MPKPALSPGALYAMLSKELRERRATPCFCLMPLPFLVERADESTPNWRIGRPAPCANGCGALIGEISRRVLDAYDLHDPTAVPAKSEMIE